MTLKKIYNEKEQTVQGKLQNVNLEEKALVSGMEINPVLSKVNGIRT